MTQTLQVKRVNTWPHRYHMDLHYWPLRGGIILWHVLWNMFKYANVYILVFFFPQRRRITLSSALTTIVCLCNHVSWFWSSMGGPSFPRTCLCKVCKTTNRFASSIWGMMTSRSEAIRRGKGGRLSGLCLRTRYPSRPRGSLESV